MDIRLIVPARRKSTRLPDKPLRLIAGVPMIVRTWRQCLLGMPAEAVTIATDDDEIAAICRAEGADVVMTSPDCLTGTDRVAEAARYRPADYYINVQGDEPIFNPADLTVLVAAANAHPDRVFVGWTPIHSEADFRSLSIPKLVATPDGKLLYMSRNAVPTTKRQEFRKAWRQVSSFGFPPAALAAYAAAPQKTPLEEIEDLEMLRFLEQGHEVYVLDMSDVSIAVDHPEDIVKVEAALGAR